MVPLTKKCGFGPVDRKAFYGTQEEIIKVTE